jgi:hypothetical protein
MTTDLHDAPLTPDELGIVPTPSRAGDGHTAASQGELAVLRRRVALLEAAVEHIARLLRVDLLRGQS